MNICCCCCSRKPLKLQILASKNDIPIHVTHVSKNPEASDGNVAPHTHRHKQDDVMRCTLSRPSPGSLLRASQPAGTKRASLAGLRVVPARAEIGWGRCRSFEVITLARFVGPLTYVDLPPVFREVKSGCNTWSLGLAGAFNSTSIHPTNLSIEKPWILKNCLNPGHSIWSKKNNL